MKEKNNKGGRERTGEIFFRFFNDREAFSDSVNFGSAKRFEFRDVRLVSR